MKLIICESTAAFIYHLRDLDAVGVPTESYSGYGWPSAVRALCGMEMAWDRMSPITSVSCRICKEEAGL